MKVRHYFRYADDFLIVHENLGHLEELFMTIRQFLDNELGLELHPNKIMIRKLRRGIDFLGYIVLPHHIVLRTKTKRRMLRKLGEKYKLARQGKISVASFNQTLQSYLGLLSHANCFELREQLLNCYGFL